MKRPRITALLVLLVTASAPAYADEDAAIAGLLQGAARTMSELPKTRDRQSVLGHYTSDYTGITDGELQTRQSLEAVVTEIDENVKAGNPVDITNRVSEIEPHVTGQVAWATWNAYSRIEVLGEVLGEVERRCTGVFTKAADAWRIRHEHCSAPWQAAPTEETGEELQPDGGEERIEG